MASDPEPTRADKHWLVQPHNIRRLIYVSLVVLAIVALLDFAIHPHAAFGVDGTPFFYSWYGFLTCVAMVVFAKLLGIFLKRPDNYYDD